MRLLTYNIHKGIGGLDRRYRLDRIVRAIAPLEPDVVLLQEVDEGVPRSRGDRQVDVLGERLGFAYRAFYPNVRLRRGHYGNAVLSRFPLDHDENLDLTVPFKKARGALHARLRVDDGSRRGSVWIWNVHLGLAEVERRIQLRRLLAWAREREPHQPTACVVAGDFNDVWGRLGPTVLEPAGFRTARRAPLTFPAWGPCMHLDRCYVRGPIELVRTYAPRNRTVHRASDHTPLVVELALR